VHWFSAKRRRRPPEPVLAGDHTRDVMPADFDEPPFIPIPSQLVQLGSLLESMSPERRQILLASQTSNGFPWWLKKWEELFPGGWPSFLALCAEAFTAIDEERPVASLLYERTK
jgi:hypothetical protein